MANSPYAVRISMDYFLLRDIAISVGRFGRRIATATNNFTQGFNF